MKARLVQRAATTGLLVAATAGSALLTGLPAASAAGEPTNGCPNGYTLMAVSDLAPQGYRVPGRLDDPSSGIRSFGSLGNGDGFTCAQEIGNRTTPWGGQLYQFWDNTLPAS